MVQATARVCAGADRCYAFPDQLVHARAGCTPKGHCKLGWVVSRGDQESSDVWLKLATGLVKLIQQAGAWADGVYGAFIFHNDVALYPHMTASCYTTIWHSTPGDRYAYYRIRAQSVGYKLSF